MSTTPWIEQIGELVGEIGAPQFGANFYRFFENVLGIEQCTVFAFPHGGAPQVLLVEANSPQLRSYARELAAQYVGGEFECDPNLGAYRSFAPATVHSLSADDLKDKRYKTRFYDEPRIAHELVLLGRQDDTLYYSSFYRISGRAHFDAHEIEMLRSLAGFALQAVNRHAQLLSGLAPEPAERAPKVPVADATPLSRERRARMLAHLKEVLLAQPHLLSPREAEICAGIVLGYTTLGLSLNLGISINTVATHRKRAYRKLGVSSQNELFSQYYEFVNRLH